MSKVFIERVVETEVTPLATPLSSTPTDVASSSSQQPAPAPRRQRRRPICPDPGSLYDIMRENCGASLFVLPILWTDAHPRLLGAEFVQQEPVLSPVPSTQSSSRSSQPRPSEIAEALSYDLTSLLSAEDTRPFCKSRAVKNVLSTLYHPVFSRPKSVVELDLHFGDRVFRGAVRVPVVWKSFDAGTASAAASFDSAATRPLSSFSSLGHHGPSGARETNDFSGVSSCNSSQTASDGPVVAYVNRSHLSMIRQNLFRIVPGPEGGDQKNTPVSRLQSLRSKQLMPSEPDCDAYMVGVFLAMAQAHFYNQTSRFSSQQSNAFWWNNRHRGDRITVVPEFHDVKLRILTHDDDTDDFIVYTAVVTAAFLQRFAEPTKATAPLQELAQQQSAEGGMRIEYARVPVWPILGLKERLGKALGPDLVGGMQEEIHLFAEDAAADALEETETLETKEDSRRRLDSLKRKRVERPALTDMLRVPFHSETNNAVIVSTSGRNSSSSNSSTGVPAATVASPSSSSSSLSPRKRRRTRSLSSSLAVC